jgi:mediator of RNA polymerase II transcription subunit 18
MARLGDLSLKPGVLRWNDFPDATGSRVVAQRKVVEIQDQKNLTQTLEENDQKFKSELIEESFSYYRDNIEYSLMRLHGLPNAKAAMAPAQSLPPWADLQPVSDEWILYIKAIVVDATPETMQHAVDALMSIRVDLTGVFDFKVFDRRVHDTRTASPQVNTLPGPLP